MNFIKRLAKWMKWVMEYESPDPVGEPVFDWLYGSRQKEKEDVLNKGEVLDRPHNDR